MVKNLPPMWETWVWSLGWEDPLEEGMANHSSILPWRIPMDRGAWCTTVHGVAKSQTWLSDFRFTSLGLEVGFPGGSAGKESTCNAGEPGLIPGSERSPGEGIGYPLQYPWAFLVAQMVKNLPTVKETWLQSLGWEDPLEEGMANHSSILAWRIPMDRGAWWSTVHGVARSWTRLSD